MAERDSAKYLAEFIGTFMLVFFAAGAVMAVKLSGSQSGGIVGGIASGLVLMIVIWIFTDVSGGHVNPALTLALVGLGLFPRRLLPGYVICQMAGSAAAGLALRGLLGKVGAMGANLPNEALGISAPYAFALEILLSAVMMVVIMAAVKTTGELARLAPVPIGAVVGIEVMLFGGLAGAAMNPARAFGPFLAHGDWHYFWIYAIGPILGIALAGWLSKYFLNQDGR